MTNILEVVKRYNTKAANLRKKFKKDGTADISILARAALLEDVIQDLEAVEESLKKREKIIKDWEDAKALEQKGT